MYKRQSIRCLKALNTNVYFSQPPLVVANLNWSIPKVRFNAGVYDLPSDCGFMDAFVSYSLSSEIANGKWELDVYVAPSFEAKNATTRVPLNKTHVCHTIADGYNIGLDTLYFSAS